MTELNINGLLLEGSSTIQLKFWSAQGGLLHSYKKKRQENCWDRTRSLINPSGGSSGGGVISLGRSGDSNKVLIKPLLIKHVPWVTQYVSLYYLPEPRSATMSFLHSPLTLERGCLWTGGTGRHYQTFWQALIYFNRGWVPQSLGNASTRQEGQVGWSDPFLRFIQTFQVIGEHEISGVLRITEQTSSLTPKNRWNFGLFRFYVVHWLSERTTWSGFQEMCQHWLRNFELCQSFLIWTWPVVKKLLKWVILF